MAVTAQNHCWQFDPQVGFPVSGSEDCLYLNLYRPMTTATDVETKHLPVIVFIHGGGFYSGTNNPVLYGPDFFMETGKVILVNITYRCGIFGFLATGDEASPGNYGLKDQTMALKWVQDNVAAFGGDPKQVTLMGQSAGSVSVSYHLVSKLSKGLFKNAVLISGILSTKWGKPMEEPRQFANKHARAAGIENPEKLTSQELVEKLRNTPASDLVEASKKFYEWDNFPVTNYAPSVEPVGSPGAFLTSDPRELMEKGEFHKVPVMASFVPYDGINFIQPLLVPGDKCKDFNENMYKVLPMMLYMDAKNPNMKQIVDKVRFKYFGPTGLVEGDEGMQEMATDYFYGKPFFWFMDSLAKNGHSPIFGHHWTYEGKSSFGPAFTHNPRKTKAVHADDLLHLFRVRMLFPEEQLSKDDERAQKMLMGQLFEFNKNDNPGYETWTKKAPKMAVFKNDTATIIRRDMMIANPEMVNYSFWEDIEKLYNEGKKLMVK